MIYDAEHFFDGFKRNPDYALRTLQAAADAGAALDRPLRHQRRRAARGGRRGRRARSSGEIAVPLGIHTHNDGDLAVANTLAAVAPGGHARCRGRSTASASGAATSTCAASWPTSPSSTTGYDVLLPGKLAHLTEVSRYVYETANMNFRPGQPFVGSSAFAHKGGMHVHGVRKNAASYEHIDPATVGNERRVLVSELSGKSNIAEKLGEYGLEQDPALLAAGARPGAGPGERGLPVRGRRGVVRAAGRAAGRPAHARGSSGSATASSVSGERRRRRPSPRRRSSSASGDVGRAHRQRGGRPGQRPRRRPAQGPGAALSRGSARCSWSTTRSA